MIIFYGPSILAEFAENIKMFDYIKHWIKKVLFETSKISRIQNVLNIGCVIMVHRGFYKKLRE